MSCGDFGGIRSGKQFHHCNPGKDKPSPQQGSATKDLVKEDKRGNPGEDGFEGEDQYGMGRRQDLLGKALNGERGHGAQQTADRKGKKNRPSECCVRWFQWESDKHRQTGKEDLKRRQQTRWHGAGGVRKDKKVGGESNRTRKRDQVAGCHAGSQVAQHSSGGCGDEQKTRKSKQRAGSGEDVSSAGR